MLVYLHSTPPLSLLLLSFNIMLLAFSAPVAPTSSPAMRAIAPIAALLLLMLAGDAMCACAPGEDCCQYDTSCVRGQGSALAPKVKKKGKLTLVLLPTPRRLIICSL